MPKNVVCLCETASNLGQSRCWYGKCTGELPARRSGGGKPGSMTSSLGEATWLTPRNRPTIRIRAGSTMRLDLAVDERALASEQITLFEHSAMLLLKAMALPFLLFGLLVWAATAASVGLLHVLVSVACFPAARLSALNIGKHQDPGTESTASGCWPVVR